MIKTYRKTLLIYGIICISLIGLSFISFIFNERILPLSVLICSVCGFLTLLLLISGRDKIGPEGTKGIFVVFLLLRYLVMIIGMVSSALLVYFTMGDEINKYRYLMVLISAIPYFMMSISLIISGD